MAHESEHPKVTSARRRTRSKEAASRGGPFSGGDIPSIGFYSVDQPDPDEMLFQIALKESDNFAWYRLEVSAGTKPLKATVSEVTDLHLAAVIAVLTTADTSVVEPLFARLRFGDPKRPILVAPRGLTADGISQLLSLGASDFLLPPYRAEDLVPRLRRLVQAPLGRDPLVARIRSDVGTRNIVGKSPALLCEVSKLPRIAACDAPVLIRGESGTGKEVFARAIHYLSARSGQPFVPVNCGAIPDQLIETELFGHRRGAFTGAIRDRTGLVGEADGGTMLLDEVDALPLASQVKLLRFLQDGEYRPLGASGSTRANVRVLAASNADFERIIEERKFRDDLYYRLNVLRLSLPPLRERQCDLPLLTHHFLEKQALILGCLTKPVALAALECMAHYRWQGNVRELENVLTRALIFSDGAEIQAQDLGLLPVSQELSASESFRALKAHVIENFERDYLQKMLDRHEGNITRAAQGANKNRRAFWELLRKHRIAPVKARGQC